MRNRIVKTFCLLNRNGASGYNIIIHDITRLQMSPMDSLVVEFWPLVVSLIPVANFHLDIVHSNNPTNKGASQKMRETRKHPPILTHARAWAYH